MHSVLDGPSRRKKVHYLVKVHHLVAEPRA